MEQVRPRWQRAIGAALMVGILASGVGGETSADALAAPLSTASTAANWQDLGEAIPGVEQFEGLSPAHVPGPINYERLPPAGGPHNPIWVNCGVYLQAVPTEMAVHSLEHGAVWITFRPDLPPSAVEALANLTRDQTHVLVSPWDGLPPLPSAIVASAWGFQLLAEDPSDPRLAEFVRRYVEGPQTPEPGAPCRGGAGTPLPLP